MIYQDIILFPFDFIVNFMKKVGYIMLKLSFFQSTPSIHHRCVHFCVGLHIALSLFVPFDWFERLFIHPHKSLWFFLILCHFVFLFFFFPLCLVNSAIIIHIKPKKKKKRLSNKNPTQWTAWPNKQTKKKKNLHKLQPTKQNPRAHLRMSGAIAPAPPTSW